LPIIRIKTCNYGKVIFNYITFYDFLEMDFMGTLPAMLHRALQTYYLVRNFRKIAKSK